MRSHAPSEYEKALEFTTPKCPLYKRGWQRASADGGLPYSGGEGTQPLRFTFPFPRREGARGIGRHGCALPNGLAAAAETILSPLRGQLLSKRSLLHSALPCAIRIRNPLEFTTSKRPLFERGWQRASADGGLPYSSGGEGAQPLRDIPPFPRRKGGEGDRPPWECVAERVSRCGRNNPQSASRTAPLPKEPFGLCAPMRHPNTKKRWSSPLPNAPFTKGGGSAQALTGDCLTQGGAP